MSQGCIKSTCPYCGVGCGVLIDQDADGQFSIEGDPDHPANYGKLCSKGSALAETLNDEKGRVGSAKINGEVAPLSDAISEVAKKFSQTIVDHGPDSVAFYVSGQLLTEDYYVANKLMKGFIGSANIDTNSRLCMSSAVAGHKRAFGADTVPVSYEDLEQSDLIVLVGSNLAWCHPVLFQRVVEAKKKRGTKIVCVDPRRTATAEQSDLHLPIKPGSDVALFNGLLRYLKAKGKGDDSFIQRHTDGLPVALEAAGSGPIAGEGLELVCGVDQKLLETFYWLFAENERVITVFSQGVNQSSQGTDKVNAILNCHLFTGRIGKPGTGPFSVTGQPNAMGGREVGGLANMLAAHMDFDEVSIDRVQRFWQSPTIALRPGLKAVDLFRAAEAGEVKAIWIMATNPVASLPDADQVKRALEACPFVVVSECFDDAETLNYADVVLPASTWGERNGTVTNSERCISRQHATKAAPGEAMNDWELIRDVAKAMGFGTDFDYPTSATVFAEHAALSAFENDGKRDFNLSGWAHVSQADYDAIEPTRWPVLVTDAAASELLTDGRFFTPTEKANFVGVLATEPKNAPSPDFPLVLNTGRLRDQWHTMTRTGRSQRLMRHIAEPFVSVHPEDALAFALEEGGFAKVTTHWGEAISRVNISTEVTRGMIFMPIHWTDSNSAKSKVGRLVNPVVDPISGQPELKHTPAQIQAWKPAWRAFSLGVDPVIGKHADYWSLIPVDGAWIVEMAGHESLADQARWVTDLIGDNGEVMTVADPSKGILRSAKLEEGKLNTAVFLGDDRSLPDRSWIAELAGIKLDDPMDRTGLLAGRPATPRKDIGRIVCACFAVGVNTIRDAIVDNGLSDAVAIGQALRAGTNCGSCIPEINKIVMQETGSADISDKSAA